MSWGLWVHVGDVAKEGVPALLGEVANVGKDCTTNHISVLDFTEPAHTEDASLTAHVECLQVVQVHLGRGPCLGRMKQLGTMRVTYRRSLVARRRWDWRQMHSRWFIL